ncbi:hypothetical protein NE857_32760 [Nocardiopsis exhalans]|uniref:Chaplin domain-containing protein n=1 Tax=Nocardiopsis exhalans TaxID=163604 RepID=A0ABY5D9N5_9ACTN|nr:hypothetical protein [Nocardiopsis exhalans]USY19943.1 hypothetical protein NE857_32760 [Nocardiopsis exhalans]
MNIPRLALAAAAAIAAFSFFGASPAAASEAPAVHSAAASNALPGLPTTGAPVRIADEVVAGVCGVIALRPCERANGDVWNDN